jgi:hypothetical protein
MVWLPSASGLEMHEKAPAAVQLAVQSVLAPSDTVTVSEATQLPEMAGIEVARKAPEAGTEMAGATGALVITVKELGALLALALPAWSV